MDCSKQETLAQEFKNSGKYKRGGQTIYPMRVGAEQNSAFFKPLKKLFRNSNYNIIFLDGT